MHGSLSFKNCSAVLIGFFAIGCAAGPPFSYSLEDPEIFIAPQSHSLRVAVAVFKDLRSKEERAWADKRKLPSDLSVHVTERIVRQLQVSAVFDQVRQISETVDPDSAASLGGLKRRGFDAVLVGELAHFYGGKEPDRSIEGQVRFTALQLFSTHTGRLLWEGTADKHIKRREQRPGRDVFYASEGLRGAINQLALQLAGLSFSGMPVYPAERPPVHDWRVGVLPPDDLRPQKERDIRTRKMEGDPNYSLYAADDRNSDRSLFCVYLRICFLSAGIETSYADRVAEAWMKQLQSEKMFGEVRIIPRRGQDRDDPTGPSGEGMDVILTGNLTHSFGAVIPMREGGTFPIWSGGIGYSRRSKATALTRLENVRLTDGRSGRLLWQGEAEHGIDRTLERWEPPEKYRNESLNEALGRLIKQLTELSAENPAP